MTDKEKFEKEALAEFLEMTGIPKERVDQYGEIRRVEFQAYGETYELKNPGLVVLFKTFSDGFLPVLYFPKKPNVETIKALEQKPKCNDCKWWKDSDGVYRRGCGAESICHINTNKVYQGEGYCYLFEPQESEEE